MAITGTGGALAVTVSTKDGLGIVSGDLIVAHCLSNGTHVANAMAVQDSVNAVPFTNGKEQQLGSGSAKWQQVLYYQAVANVPDGSTITLTPFAAATVTGLSVTVVRYVLGTVSNAFVSQGNTANTAQGAPALGAAPTIGQFVMTFDAADSGTLTQAAAFALDSAVVGASCTLANAYATADGVSTFASTWTDTASVVSATMTVAFTFAGVGVPYRVGQLTSVAGSATSVVTVATTTIANDALFVVCGSGGGGVPTANSVADTKSHTYTLAASVIAPNGMCVWIFQSLHAATPLLSSGDTVTVTWSGTTASKNVEVIACAGVNATAALDQIASAYASGAAPSVTAANSLANNNELVLAAITSGYATAGITWTTGTTAMDAGLRSASSPYTSVGTQVITNSTSAPTAGATLGATGVWAELMITLLPDPPAGAAATITITNASPLPPGQVGVAYSTQMAATGGAPPYTWSVTSGSLPSGLTIQSGSGGGGAADFTYVGVNTGPQGAPTLARFNSCVSTFSPMGCYKFFFTALPSSWVGTLMDQITSSAGGQNTFCYISWGTTVSATVIKNFVLSIPSKIPSVGFVYESEPEASMSGTTYVNNFLNQAAAVRAVQPQTTTQLIMLTSSLTSYYRNPPSTGQAAYIPPPSTSAQAGVDVYGMDFYDHHSDWVGSSMSSSLGWVNWVNHVKGFGKPIALTEFGISGAGSDAAQNTRLQANWNYLKTAFGPGGSISQLPLFLWLYWNTGGTSFSLTDPGSGLTVQNEMLGPATQATWKGIAGTQSGGGGGGTGGLISGTPTVAGTSTPTIRATDSAAAFGSKAFSLVVSGSGSLAVATTSLPGGTVGTAYSGGQLAATGGTTPYTWSLQSGTLPPGLSIVGQSITGTPSSNGTSSFVIKVTDNVAATATASLSIAISTGLTVTTTTLPGGQVGVAYAFTLASAGGTPPYTWGILSTQDLPPGVILDPLTGILSGTPTIAGSFPLTFTLLDGASASATSAPMTLAVSPVTGGLAPIGRRRFGGTTADWTFQFVGDAVDRAAGVTVTFYNALTGGTQITDLTTSGGGPITSVVSDASGEIPEFFGPDSVLEMFADANGGLGPRRRVTAADLGDLTVAMYNALKLLTG
jgi:hypothetical protein